MYAQCAQVMVATRYKYYGSSIRLNGIVIDQTSMPVPPTSGPINIELLATKKMIPPPPKVSFEIFILVRVPDQIKIIMPLKTWLKILQQCRLSKCFKVV